MNDAGLPQAYEADPRPDCDDSGGDPSDGTCKYYTQPEYVEPMSIWWQVSEWGGMHGCHHGNHFLFTLSTLQEGESTSLKIAKEAN